jgi:glutamine synthetase
MSEPLEPKEQGTMHATADSTRKEDVLKLISQNNIRILNLCHIPEDGRLKTLSFAPTDTAKTEEILELGERVDGSNLFSFLEPGRSDIYIVPRLEKAFINPFSPIPSLSILCDYLDADGKPLEAAPQNALTRAEDRLSSSKGIALKALAELEFYIISKQESEPLFPADPDRNYHDSAPFTRFEDVRNEILATLPIISVATKYGHSEVGRIVGKNGEFIEQQEIELAAQTLSRMAESVPLAKWVIRNVCARHGLSVSFAPKIAAEHAGTGMHIHICALRKGKNLIANTNGTLSVEAMKMVGGILKFAPSLSAFANPTPISYLRFIARKESPMHVCWSERNRLALIRIPLWRNLGKSSHEVDECGETFEYRAPDAFANPYTLLAGITVAANYGLNNPREALKTAKDLHVKNSAERKRLKTLPLSCGESADSLAKDRQLYESKGVFSTRLIDKTIESLKSYDDKHLWQNLANKPAETEKVLRQYRHYG